MLLFGRCLRQLKPPTETDLGSAFILALGLFRFGASRQIGAEHLTKIG
jgi:hypothetical protein